MMRDIRIVFMGTPDFAVATLKALVENNYHVVGVITAPDKPAGRGMKLHQSAVKEYALSQHLEVLQPTNLKDESFIAQLKSLNANLQIVVAFRMLPKVVWQMPEYGTFNLHASLLPHYRGAAPINWAIINGETKTGVTTFFIDEKIDTGNMILQEELDIAKDDTAGTLHDKLMQLGSLLVIKTVKMIKNNAVITSIQEESADLKQAYKLHRETCKIDWNKNVDEIYNHIRGLSPYPSAWTTLYNNDDIMDIKVQGVESEHAQHSFSLGTIIPDKSVVKVAVKEGFILLTEIQFPGKRKMNIRDILNGYHFNSGAYLR